MSVIPLRVAVRVRPLIPKEVDEGCQTCLTYMPEEQQIILGKDRSFTYDFVFKPTDPQISVYEEIVQSLIKHIFKGYNATVLAYGQTGSGKTFTMGGGYEASLSMDPEGMGIIPRIVQELFTIMADKEDYDFTVNVSYLEIINEELQDLLVTGKKDSMTIREENGEIKIPKLREVPVTSVEATMKCLQLGCGNRTTAATAMNSTSSRSHAIFTLSIESKHKEESNDYWKAKLQLVDLAGSERIKKTHAEGERLKEGININKGLLSLGNVISVLGDENNKKAHIPYRDSKLTRILQDSLGGNSHTLMIACVSPADSNMEETLNTLRYADRARKIKNKPVVNWDPKTAEIMNLKAKVQELTMKLIQSGMSDLAEQAISRAPMPVPSSPGRNKELADKVDKLMKQCQQLEEELQVSVDQAATASERAIKWEMRCERLKERLRELEQSIGVDFDLLSSSLVDGNPVITDQLDKLRNFAARLNESLTTDGSEENDCIFEEKEPDLEDVADETMDGLQGPSYAAAATPESQEMAIQHTRRRARLNTELQELNKILEHKERLANQFSRNDNKMAELKEQYEGNMKSLEEKIGSLEKEKDNLSTALEGARANQAANKVSEQRRKKLQELETRMGDLRKQLTEQRKVLKLKEQKEKEVLKMNSEIVTLKQHRVKLMKQMKEDADTWRKFKQQKDKEVLQLQQKDRKKQFQIQKLQRENERTQNVLQRKSEEAAVANRRLKEAVLKQKKVIEERSSKFDKYDNTAIGNRVKKWLSHELDVKVGIIEVKYHRENLIQDRKTLANQLKSLKDDSDASHEDDFHSKIQHLENQIELRNVQISDLQQKILDAEQEGKGKSVKDNLHTMMEAKIALKWLLDQAVSYKAANDRVKMDLTDLRETVQEDKSENEEYIEQLEEKIEALKKEHTSTVMEMQMAMQNDHQQEIKILLASVGAQAADVDVVKRLETQNSEICRLKEVNEMLQLKAERMQNHLTKYMWQDKSICLLPPVARLPEDEKLTEDQRSPFLSPRPKIAMPELLREADKQYKRRKTALFEQPDELKLKEKRQSGGCGCTGNCKTNRCNCRKNKQFCSAMCNCKSCENEEVQLPESTTTSDQEQTTSSVMNSTFEVEPSREENDDDSSSRSSTENKPVIGAGPKKAGKPPKAPKFSRQTSHSVLSTIQTPSDYRSSDEFEKPKLLRKSVSAGMLRKKRSSARLSGAEAKDSSVEAESGEEVSTMLDSFAKKKRRLNNPTKNYFGSIDSS